MCRGVLNKCTRHTFPPVSAQTKKRLDDEIAVQHTISTPRIPILWINCGSAEMAREWRANPWQKILWRNGNRGEKNICGTIYSRRKSFLIFVYNTSAINKIKKKEKKNVTLENIFEEKNQGWNGEEDRSEFNCKLFSVKIVIRNGGLNKV